MLCAFKEVDNTSLCWLHAQVTEVRNGMWYSPINRLSYPIHVLQLPSTPVCSIWMDFHSQGPSGAAWHLSQVMAGLSEQGHPKELCLVLQLQEVAPLLWKPAAMFGSDCVTQYSLQRRGCIQHEIINNHLLAVKRAFADRKSLCHCVQKKWYCVKVAWDKETRIYVTNIASIRGNCVLAFKNAVFGVLFVCLHVCGGAFLIWRFVLQSSPAQSVRHWRKKKPVFSQQ